MKTLFACMPHNTHYYPMLPLAWALRAAGHEVRIAAQPDLTEAITRTGMTAVQVGSAEWYANDPWEPELFGTLLRNGGSEHVQHFDWAGTDPEAWTWQGLLGLEKVMIAALFAAINSDTMVDDLVSYARSWRPDVVIWEQFTFAGALAARTIGVPHARFVYGPDITGRARRAFLGRAAEQPAEHREDPSRDWLGETMRRFGGSWDESLRTGEFVIDTTAPGTRLETGGRVVGMRYIPHNGRSVVPQWLLEPVTRPRICLTLGVSEEIDDPAATIGEVLAGLADLDVEVVATLNAGQAADIGELPENVRAVDFVPLHELFPTCAAVVHHGGVGTRLTAEYHGVPQLILAYGHDTLVAGARLAELQAGRVLPAGSASSAAIRTAVEALLTEPVAAGAAALQNDLLSEPSPAAVVSTVEKMVEELSGTRR